MAVETSGVANSSQQLQSLAARSQLLVTANLPPVFGGKEPTRRQMVVFPASV